MDRRDFCVTMLNSGLALGSLSSFLSAESAGDDGVSPQKIKWHKNLKAAHRLSIETGRPMLIVFGATWCHYCHKLERETLADKRLAAVIERDFVPVLLDFDKDARVAKILEVEKLPCSVVLSPEADLLMKSEGFKDYKGYLKVLQASLERRAAIRQVGNRAP